MDPISDGCRPKCRLCLDTFAKCFTTIDNPQLKHQMEKVFCFSIEFKQGYCFGVCQSCSYVISEFYQYSEKVRHNQELLNDNVSNSDPNVDSKITIKNIEIEMLSDSGLPETTKDDCELKDHVSGEEEVAVLHSKIPLENIKLETLCDCGLPETTEDACKPKDEVSGDEEVAALHSEITIENIKIEMINDSGLPETTEDACERKDEVSGDEEVPNSSDDSKANTNNSKQTIFERRNDEDQLINKHFHMVCYLCGTPAVTIQLLRNHLWKEHKQRNGYVMCCNRKLTSRQVMLDHIAFHANPDVFRCDKCNNSFACKKSLKKHMTRLHSGKNRTMVCDTCGKGFMDKRNLLRHMNEHKGIEEQRIQCEICQRWLKGKRNLRYHMKYVHTDVDPEYQCDICLQKYKHAYKLKAHKLVTHAEPKHKCEFCGKKFKWAHTLMEHRTKHTGEVLHPCQHCGKANKRKTHLHNHIKRKHPTEWEQMKLLETQKSGPA